MRIYRFWQQRKEEINGTTIFFKAGSNESEAHADSIIDRKIEYYRMWQSGEDVPEETIREMDAFFAEKKENLEYEVPVCEEWVEALDEHNIVTRNRYGALVLNSEDHTFLDIDDVPPTLGERISALFGGKIRSKEERILDMVDKVFQSHPELSKSGVRVYATAKGVRILLSLSMYPAYSYAVQRLMYHFHVDKLYATLCARQNCYRARLTPKPARIAMRTALKFKFPYDTEREMERSLWLAEYDGKSMDYAVCRLIRTYGPDFSSPVTEYHDRICKVDSDLPLA